MRNVGIQVFLAAVVLALAPQALANRACCLEDGTCVTTQLQDDCYALGGTPQPDALTCDEADCGPYCGDGEVNRDSEECDDGNDDNNDGCRNDCTLPFCGDGILDDGEECDDGNFDDGDGCSANCTIEDPPGGEGCPPSFWTKPNNMDEWYGGYGPDDLFDVVFGVDFFGDATLLEMLRASGGGPFSLGRHAVTALLNAAHPDVDFLFSVDDVIAIVQEAFDTGNYDDARQMLKEQNAEGCPLVTKPGRN